MRTDFKINERILVSQFDSETKIVFYPIRDKTSKIAKTYMICTIIYDLLLLMDLKLPDLISSLFIILFFIFLVTNFWILIFISRFLFELINGKGFNKTYLVLKNFGFNFLKETIVLNNISSFMYVYNVFDKESNFHKNFSIDIASITKISFVDKEYSIWFVDKNNFIGIMRGYFITNKDIHKVKSVIKDKLNENKSYVPFVDKNPDGLTPFETAIVRLN